MVIMKVEFLRVDSLLRTDMTLNAVEESRPVVGSSEKKFSLSENYLTRTYFLLAERTLSGF